MTKFKVQAVLTREYKFEIDAENAAQAKDAALNQIGEGLGIITSEWTIDCTIQTQYKE